MGIAIMTYLDITQLNVVGTEETVAKRLALLPLTPAEPMIIFVWIPITLIMMSMMQKSGAVQPFKYSRIRLDLIHPLKICVILAHPELLYVKEVRSVSVLL